MYQPVKLKLSLAAGRGQVVLKTGDATALGFKAGMKITGVVYKTSYKNDDNFDRIFGPGDKFKSKFCLWQTESMRDHLMDW